MSVYGWDPEAGRMVRRASAPQPPVVFESEGRLMRYTPEPPPAEPVGSARPTLPPIANPSRFSAWITEGIGERHRRDGVARIRAFYGGDRVPAAHEGMEGSTR